MLTMIRAYTAASRRSDRSLELRVRSAQNASRIHKAKCGRALHITEELVARHGIFEEVEDYNPKKVRLEESNKRLQIKEQEFLKKLSAALAAPKTTRPPPPPPQQQQPVPEMPLSPYFFQQQLDGLPLFEEPQMQLQLQQMPQSPYMFQQQLDGLSLFAEPQMQMQMQMQGMTATATDPYLPIMEPDMEEMGFGIMK